MSPQPTQGLVVRKRNPEDLVDFRLLFAGPLVFYGAPLTALDLVSKEVHSIEKTHWINANLTFFFDLLPDI